MSEDSNDLSLVSSISIPSFSSYTTTSVEISDVLPDCVEVTSVLTASPRWFGDGVEPEVVEVIYDFSNCFSNTEGGTPATARITTVSFVRLHRIALQKITKSNFILSLFKKNIVFIVQM